MLLGHKISIGSPRCGASKGSTSERKPSSRLDGPGRPRNQDRRAPRDHRLGEADPRQGRRDEDVLRRRARRERGQRPRSSSTGCRAGRPRRRTSSSSTSVFRRCRRCASPSRRCGLDMHRKVQLIVSGRHPERRGRREGARARRRRGLDRDGRADRDGGADLQEEYEQIRSAAGFTTTGRRGSTRRASRRRRTSSRRASTRSSAASGSRTTFAS